MRDYTRERDRDRDRDREKERADLDRLVGQGMHRARCTHLNNHTSISKA